MKSVVEILVDEEKIDHLGHMNYLEYIIASEKGIIEWYRQAGLTPKELSLNSMGTVMIKLDVSYLKEARLGETLRVVTTPFHLGTKSFSLKQAIYNQDNVVITEITKTFVMFNTATRKGIPVIVQLAKQFLEENAKN